MRLLKERRGADRVGPVCRNPADGPHVLPDGRYFMVLVPTAQGPDL